MKTRPQLLVVIFLVLVAPARAGVGEWTQKCEQGDGAACHNAASVHKAAGDFDVALPFFKRACELGARCDLADLGDRLHFLGKTGEAKALFEMGCAKGDRGSCGKLAAMLAIGDGVAVDTGAAIALLRPLCEGPSPWVCSELARIYNDGDGVPLDLVRGTDFAARLAKFNREALEKSFATSQDQTEKGRQLGADCIANKPHACINAVTFYTHNVDDPEQALRFTQEGCRHAPQTCQGWSYAATALGRSGQDDRARSVLEAACDAKQGSACRDRGLYLFLGEYGSRDLATAERLVRPECDAGQLGACHVLGLVLSAKRDHKAAHATLVKVAERRRAERWGPGNASEQFYKQGAEARTTQLEQDRVAAAIVPYDAILKDLSEESKEMVATRRSFDRLEGEALTDVQNLEHYQPRNAGSASIAAEWIARRKARQDAIRKLVKELRSTAP